MPDRALYYPYTTIWEPEYLFDSLLYWDSISCIVPSKEYRESVHHFDTKMQSVMDKARERFTHKLVPSEKQKRDAHQFLRSTLLEYKPQENSIDGTTTFYTLKLDPLTLELLLIGGWLEDTNANLGEIEEYIAKRKSGDTKSYPPNYSFKLPRGLGNLLMAALAASCSSENMPPVTSDYYGFRDSINQLLGFANVPKDQKLDLTYTTEETDQLVESFSPKLSEAVRSEDLRYLFATIPHLGYESSYGLPPQMLNNLIIARSKDNIQELQKSFREVVDTYLTQLHDADESERQIIMQEFKHKVTRDLNLLQKELKRLAVEH